MTFFCSITVGLAGLAISFALSVTQSLNWTVRMASDMESQMVSVGEWSGRVDVVGVFVGDSGVLWVVVKIVLCVCNELGAEQKNAAQYFCIV